MKNIKKKTKRLFYLRVAVFMTFFLGLCLAFSTLQVQAARLFGVTGNFATPPETLFELSQVDATPTFVMTLGAGDDGEAIAFNPVDGLLYHLSGETQGGVDEGAIFESIDPNTLAPPTNIPYDGFNADDSGVASEALAFTFNPSTGEFLVVDLDIIDFTNSFFYSLNTDGTVTELGPMDHSSKGLAFVGSSLYSIEQSFGGVPRLFQINPGNGSTNSSVLITLEGFILKGANGLATHPDTGELWALLKAKPDASTPAERLLVTIDPSTGVATNKGSTGDRFASIAFATSIIEFSDFTLKKTMIKFKHKLNNDEFMVKGKFILGEPNDGIDPVNEDVTVNVGTSWILIPSPYSFVEETAGKFKFMGKIDGADVKMKIVGTFDTFKFEIMAKGVDLTGTPNPVLVGLAVGNDIAQSSIRLKGELSKHKHKH